MHLIKLLTRPGAVKSISQYGTQNKEENNSKNKEYLATMARRTDIGDALKDVYTPDSQASSVEIRRLGSMERQSEYITVGSVGMLDIDHQAVQDQIKFTSRSFMFLNFWIRCTGLETRQMTMKMTLQMRNQRVRIMLKMLKVFKVKRLL
jgi:hypothetical protein